MIKGGMNALIRNDGRQTRGEEREGSRRPSRGGKPDSAALASFDYLNPLTHGQSDQPRRCVSKLSSQDGWLPAALARSWMGLVVVPSSNG